MNDAFKVLGWTPDYVQHVFGNAPAWKLQRAIEIERQSVSVVDLTGKFLPV